MHGREAWEPDSCETEHSTYQHITKLIKADMIDADNCR